MLPIYRTLQSVAHSIFWTTRLLSRTVSHLMATHSVSISPAWTLCPHVLES